MDEADRMTKGTQLGQHDGRSEFWQINFGHVLVIIFGVGGWVGGGVHLASLLTEQSTTTQLGIQSLANAQSEFKSDLSDVKSQIGEMRSWRDHQDAENATWHASIDNAFDDIKRHLERLDWIVGARPAEPPYSPQAIRPRGR